MAQFRYNLWDPVLILGQIAAMQALFYISFGVWLGFADSFSPGAVGLDVVFSPPPFADMFFGWMVVAAYIFSALSCAAGELVIVRRAKQCLDYAATVHILHFAACWAYGGFPSLSWWLVNVASLALMAIVGEYVCMRYEMTAIPLFGSRGAQR